MKTRQKICDAFIALLYLKVLLLLYHYYWVVFFPFETGSHIAHTCLKFLTLLPPPPKCSNYRYTITPDIFYLKLIFEVKKNCMNQIWLSIHVEIEILEMSSAETCQIKMLVLYEKG